MRLCWSLWMVCLVAVACKGAVTVPNRTVPYEGTVELPPPPPLATAEAPVVDVASYGKRGAEPLTVLTDPGELPRLRLASQPDQLLPLRHTHVDAHLLGHVAAVEVTQTFENPYARPIEVVYVFPLPESSAVGAMEMRIGERVVRAEIDERRRARRRYRRARRRGHTAALLEQERPNVFTQSVANIAPGERIDVVIRYVQDLTYDEGRYELVFPLVVGPRFTPGAPLDGPPAGYGTHADTDEVPDASRVTPPYLGRGERSGHDVSIVVRAESAFPITEVEVPTHEVVRHPTEGGLHVTLADHGSIPNRDFVLRYRVAGPQPKATLVTSGGERGYFLLAVHPPDLPVDDLVGRRELLFVVDVSGSMRGRPLGMAKAAIRQALQKMRPWDTFDILTFAGHTSRLFGAPRPANRAAIDAALRFLDRASARGGTRMGGAVEQALRPNVAEGRHRYVFFLTDGEVSHEAAIFEGSARLVEALEQRGQRARVFGFGVGSSVNRHLLEGLARRGKGITVYATNREDPARAVNRYFHVIDRAVLTDLRVDGGLFADAEVVPHPVPDLFASRPVILHGRYTDRDDLPTQIEARRGEDRVLIPVGHHQLLTTGPGGGLLASLWARARVEDLEQAHWIGDEPDAPRAIRDLGLEFGLVTPYTSFVAIDRSRRVGNGQPDTVVQPVEVPEDVDRAGAGIAAGADASPTGADAPPPSAMAASPADPELLGVEKDRYEEADAAPAPPSAQRGDRGCYCRAPSGPSSCTVDGWWLFGLGLLVIRRRRRQSLTPPGRR